MLRISVLLLLLQTLPVALAQDNRFQPEKTWVLVVGALDWKEARYSSFSKQNRRDQRVVDLLKSRGVPDKQILLLQDKDANVKRLQQAFEKFYSKAEPDHLLFFYFCGHGYLDDAGRGHLALYDTSDKNRGLSMAQLINSIESTYRGLRVFMAIDAPRSSELVRELSGRRTLHQFAAVTSSSSSQLNSTRWTFTDALLDALAGAPCADQNGDEEIDLRELSKFISDDVEPAEQQLVSYTTQGDFKYDFVFAKASGRVEQRYCERVVTPLKQDLVARITQVEGSQYRLHFLGTEKSEDITVAFENISAVKPVTFELGQRVEVNWKGGWYPARVLQVRGSVHQVHYEGYSKVWDEWVSVRRIRVPN